MSAVRLRYVLIGLVAAAAVVNVLATRSGSHALATLAFGLFAAAVLTYVHWRRRVRAERSARVFDREAKTDETGPRTDQ